MLRITKIEENSESITMKLEGKIASDWVALLENECRRCMEGKRKVLLDFSGVTFVDETGLEVLSKMKKENIQVLECSELIQYLLEGGEKK